MSFTIRKVGDEWCAFHPGGREVARARTKELLASYVDSLNSVQAVIDTLVSGVSDTGKATVNLGTATVTVDYTQEPLVFAKISYRTRARSTGAATASGRLTTKGQWGAMCVSHGTTVGPFSSGTEAEKLTSKPQEWCSDCSNIFDGVLPKVPKDAELDELL